MVAAIQVSGLIDATWQQRTVVRYDPDVVPAYCAALLFVVVAPSDCPSVEIDGGYGGRGALLNCEPVADTGSDWVWWCAFELWSFGVAELFAMSSSSCIAGVGMNSTVL